MAATQGERPRSIVPKDAVSHPGAPNFLTRENTLSLQNADLIRHVYRKYGWSLYVTTIHLSAKES